MDGVGNALSANLLGGSVTVGGVPFAISGSGGVLETFGQKITLPAGTFQSLDLLATSVDGNQPNQTFKVTFANGTSQTFTQGVSDWYTPQDYAPSETVALTMPYRDRFNGTQDNRNFNLYEYTFTFSTPEQVASITLPDNGHVDVLAMTLVAPVAAPTLTATAATGAVNLSWTVPGGTITGYNIFRGTLATGLSDTPLNSAPLSSGTTTYQDTDVVAGNTYYYVVQALDGATASPKSNVQSATVPNTATTTEIDLTGAFNRAGITVDGQPFSGGLDGHGNALSENLLANSSLGATFDLGTAATAGVVQALDRPSACRPARSRRWNCWPPA